MHDEITYYSKMRLYLTKRVDLLEELLFCAPQVQTRCRRENKTHSFALIQQQSGHCFYRRQPAHTETCVGAAAARADSPPEPPVASTPDPLTKLKTKERLGRNWVCRFRKNTFWFDSLHRKIISFVVCVRSIAALIVHSTTSLTCIDWFTP